MILPVVEMKATRFEAGGRGDSLVERAGGGTSRALPDGLNLAAELADGQQVVLPSRSPSAGSPVGSAATEESTSAQPSDRA